MISKKIECYEIHRANMPQNGCTVQCKECAEVQQNKMQNVPEYFFSYYQPLFDHMSRHHGLTLLQGEMDEIVRVVREITEQPETMPFQYPVLEGYEIVTRDGRKVEQLVRFEGGIRRYAGLIEKGDIETWWEDGIFVDDLESEIDLFLRRKEKKVWVVEFEGTWSEIYSNYPADKIDPHNKIYEATLKQINQQ